MNLFLVSVLTFQLEKKILHPLIILPKQILQIFITEDDICMTFYTSNQINIKITFSLHQGKADLLL